MKRITARSRFRREFPLFRDEARATRSTARYASALALISTDRSWWRGLLSITKARPHVCSELAARRASEHRFEIRQPDIVGPMLGADAHRVGAMKSAQLINLTEFSDGAGFALISREGNWRSERRLSYAGDPVHRAIFFGSPAFNPAFV
jgi:hypothetical protein